MKCFKITVLVVCIMMLFSVLTFAEKIGSNKVAITPPYYDTVNTPCINLVIDKYGSMGLDGVGKVNMDFVGSGIDCDTTADVYLYDGSPVILWIDDTGTVMYSSVFGNSGFESLGGYYHSEGYPYNMYSTGTFITNDSSIAFEKIYFSNPSGSFYNDCNYIVQLLRVWSYDGQAKTGLRIGEVIDWDIPSDSGTYNSSGYDSLSNLLYQQGIEYGVDTACQDNDGRFGGIAFFESSLEYDYGNIIADKPYSAFTGRLDSLVFPNGRFVPSELWELMGNDGYTLETSQTDLLSVVCYDDNLSLEVGEVYEFFTILVSIQSGQINDIIYTVEDAKHFILNNYHFRGCPQCCIGIRGDMDYDMDIDIADLVYMVNYIFNQGPPAPCFLDQDVNGDWKDDIADLVYLVDYMFGGGPAPVPCCWG